MNDKVDKLIKVKAIVAFRDKHFKEMEKNLKVAKAVRDNEDAKDKDRIDAIKTIARMLGTLQPDKTDFKASAKPTQQVDQELTPDENKKLDELLNGKH